jgi:c-di-GMP-related signal transduction protein
MVRLSAIRVMKPCFEDYMILGDDIVIFNEQVALEYMNLMESIGVSVKRQDSIMPKPAHSLEIAKRLFRRGKEISPVP